MLICRKGTKIKELNYKRKPGVKNCKKKDLLNSLMIPCRTVKIFCLFFKKQLIYLFS